MWVKGCCWIGGGGGEGLEEILKMYDFLFWILNVWQRQVIIGFYFLLFRWKGGVFLVCKLFSYNIILCAFVFSYCLFNFKQSIKNNCQYIFYLSTFFSFFIIKLFIFGFSFSHVRKKLINCFNKKHKIQLFDNFNTLYF